MITKSYAFGAWIFIDRQVPSILAGVSTMNALVVGNGSFIIAAYGLDLHSLTSPFLRKKLSQTWLGYFNYYLPLQVQSP